MSGRSTSEDRFEALARALDAYVWEMGPDLRYTYFSRRVEEMLPVRIEDMIGTTRAGQGQDADGRLAISVKDTGIGMSRDEIQVALTPFGRIANPMTRTQDGTGSGLPLAKTLAELHGGALDIASQPGAGTAVTLTLPARRRVNA